MNKAFIDRLISELQPSPALIALTDIHTRYWRRLTSQVIQDRRRTLKQMMVTTQLAVEIAEELKEPVEICVQLRELLVYTRETYRMEFL